MKKEDFNRVYLSAYPDPQLRLAQLINGEQEKSDAYGYGNAGKPIEGT